MVKKGRMRYVVGCSGWPACVAHWPVGGEGEGVGFFGEEMNMKKKKKETGVQTQLIARADIYLTLEAVVVDTLPHTTNKQNGRKTLRAELWRRAQRMGSEALLPPNNSHTINNPKSRQALRTEMRARARCRETETERHIQTLKRRRRWGLAAAALVVGGYFLGAGEKVKEVLGAGERVEDFAVWQRGVWVEEMREVVKGIGR